MYHGGKPRSVGADPGGWGIILDGFAIYNFVKISKKKPHGIEKILGREGGGRAGCNPNRSATDLDQDARFLISF